MRVKLYDGPLDGRMVDVDKPLPLDLTIEGSRYIFWFSESEATNGCSLARAGYAFSGRVASTSS